MSRDSPPSFMMKLHREIANLGWDVPGNTVIMMDHKAIRTSIFAGHLNPVQ